MKKSILFVMISLMMVFAASSSAITEDSYCDGWDDGYCEGWKDERGQFAICPLTPICPIPKVGLDSYRDGYNRGFKAGIKAATRD